MNSDSRYLIDAISKLTGRNALFRVPCRERKTVITYVEEIYSKLITEGINCAQLNEILLLFNLRSISKDFFEFFFCEYIKNKKQRKVDAAGLLAGITKFRMFAMLKYGNFSFAFKELSKTSFSFLENKFADLIKSPREIVSEYKNRPSELLKITKIPRDKTQLLGYMTPGKISLDQKNLTFLKRYIENNEFSDWSDFKQSLCLLLNSNEDLGDIHYSEIIEIITNRFEKNTNNNSTKMLEKFKKIICDKYDEVEKIAHDRDYYQSIGKKNSNLYLSWDYMDVYFATSMRTENEYEDIGCLVRDIMKQKQLKDLNIRYFDPTQSWEPSRIDKGIIEGLMLKRSICTVYSMQETDTLGKDSELAATLAQGKPVIAYIETIDPEKRYLELQEKPLYYFLKRITQLQDKLSETKVQSDIYNYISSEKGLGKSSLSINTENIKEALSRFINTILEAINRIDEDKIWASVETDWANEDEWKKENDNDFKIFCKIIAVAEKHYNDSRAKGLKKTHPLGIQMELNTGIANGVLIARNTEQCAELLKRIITNSLEFIIAEEREEGCWALKESTTESIYRVVTKNEKLTNSFWNFYLK